MSIAPPRSVTSRWRRCSRGPRHERQRSTSGAERLVTGRRQLPPALRAAPGGGGSARASRRSTNNTNNTKRSPRANTGSTTGFQRDPDARLNESRNTLYSGSVIRDRVFVVWMKLGRGWWLMGVLYNRVRPQQGDVLKIALLPSGPVATRIKRTYAGRCGPLLRVPRTQSAKRRTSASLSQPNVVAVHDFDRTDGGNVSHGHGKLLDRAPLDRCCAGRTRQDSRCGPQCQIIKCLVAALRL